jgi:transcriptional regulator with XRE-family HTH domain
MLEIFDPAEFGEWLSEAYQDSPFKSWQQVADRVGTTRSTLSRLAGAKPQSLTGKPGQPNPDLVVKLAKLFGKDVNEALIKGGHAPIDRYPAESGLFRGIEKLSPERQELARRQIRAIIESLSVEEHHDFDYVEEDTEDKNSPR